MVSFWEISIIPIVSAIAVIREPELGWKETVSIWTSNNFYHRPVIWIAVVTGLTVLTDSAVTRVLFLSFDDFAEH